jgi:hypothetical protein
MCEARPQSGLRHNGSTLLKQCTITNSGWAGGLTSPTSKAKMQLIGHNPREREISFGHTAQKMHTTARRTGLLAGQSIRRTGRKTQTAMDAVQGSCIEIRICIQDIDRGISFGR